MYSVVICVQEGGVGFEQVRFRLIKILGVEKGFHYDAFCSVSLGFQQTTACRASPGTSGSHVAMGEHTTLLT